MTTRTRTHTKVRRWSQSVTEHSHAMDLEPKVFTQSTPRAIARSVKEAAEHSHTRKSSPFRSAMSMLSFYMNRAGKQLPAADHKKLQRAKDELRDLFHKDRANSKEQPDQEKKTRKVGQRARHNHSPAARH